MAKGAVYAYRYNVGDVIETKTGKIRIEQQTRTEKTNRKAYIYTCLNDGYVGSMEEPQLKKGCGCIVCAGQKVVKGINDVATTHPELVKYFVNIEDAYTKSHGNKDNIEVRCDVCGGIKKSSIVNLKRVGVCCKRCSDGRPYPEKFMYGLLEQIGVEFEHDIQFNWSNKKRYDFYLPNENIIIETHGLQHYKDFNFFNNKEMKLARVIENDNYKKQMALENLGCKYIVLDCRRSMCEWIKDSVEKSMLNELFDLSKIDWQMCEKKGSASLVKDVCDDFNRGFRTSDLAKMYKKNRTTIVNYLKQGTNIGWCNYDPIIANGETKRKRVMVIETGDEFDSIRELCDKSQEMYGVKFTRQNVSSACRGEYKQHKGYTFKYV